MACMLAGFLGLALFVGFVILITYAHGPGRADGKTKAVWDCGIDGCKGRNRYMHKHPAASG